MSAVIVHPTDFSEASAEAFAHALRIALAMRGTLYILHVAPGRRQGMDEFPQVRRTLAQWGLMDETESPQVIQDRLGVRVAKLEVRAPSPSAGLRHFLLNHRADLLVLATEARDGIERLRHGSVAEALAREAKAPTLFVSAKARGFVNDRGDVRLDRVLIPVDHAPNPTDAVTSIMKLAQVTAGHDVVGRLMHAGTDPPRVAPPGLPDALPVALREGNPIERILEEAADWPADLIGMATAGHRSVLDALLGSTTERVLRQAPCPVLAVPAE